MPFASLACKKTFKLVAYLTKREKPKITEYLIFDRDRIFSLQVKQFIKNMDIKPKLISYQAPWQNGVVERWIQSARHEMLNHVLVLSEEHLRRLFREYIKYCNNDRCHLTLDRNTSKGHADQ